MVRTLIPHLMLVYCLMKRGIRIQACVQWLITYILGGY
jgi:hypothetical protein